MRDRTLLILTALVLGLGAFIWFFERHQPTTEEARKHASKVFGGLESSSIQNLELTNPAGTFAFERIGSGWRMVRPIGAEADSAAVDRLVSAVTNLEADRRLGADEAEPAEYGLDRPPHRVTMADGQGGEFTLDIGAETALGGKHAVSAGGPDIILTTGGFGADLDRGLDDWRSRSLAEVFLHDLATFRVESGTERLEAVRIGDSWRLTAPLEDLADEELLRNVTTDLNAVTIEEFLDEPVPPADLGLEPARLVVSLMPSSGEASTVLEFGAEREVEGGRRIACRRNGSDLFWVTDRAETGLGKAPVRWREPKVLPFETWDVNGLSVATPTADLGLIRSEGLWKTADGAEVDAAKVQDRLTALAGMEATHFDLMTMGRPEIGRVSLSFDRQPDAAADEISFLFFEPLGDGGDVLVTVTGRDTVMSVSPEDFLAVLGDLENLPDTAEPAAEEDVSR